MKVWDGITPWRKKPQWDVPPQGRDVDEIVAEIIRTQEYLAHRIDIRDHGASKLLTNNNGAIQAAINQAPGTVFIPGGRWTIDPAQGPIVLKSNTRLLLDPDAELFVKNDAGDYRSIFIHDTGTLENVFIEGGTINQNATGNTTSNIVAGDLARCAMVFHITSPNVSRVVVRGVNFDPCVGVNTFNVGAGANRIWFFNNYLRFLHGASLSLPYDSTDVYLEGAGGCIVNDNHFYSGAFSDNGSSVCELHSGHATFCNNVIERRIGGVHIIPPYFAADQSEETSIAVCGNTMSKMAFGIIIGCGPSALNLAPVTKNVSILGNTIGLDTPGHNLQTGFGIDLKCIDGGKASNIGISHNEIYFKPDLRLPAEPLSTNGVWAGIRCMASAASIDNVDISHNNIENAPWQGIHLGGNAANALLNNIRTKFNTIIDAGINPTPTGLRAGLEITGALTDCEIEYNKVIDRGTSALNGLTAFRVYPTVPPVRSTFRHNRKISSLPYPAWFIDCVPFIGGYEDDFEIIPYAAAVTPDAIKGSNKQITLTGNITINNPAVAGFSANPYALTNQVLNFIFIQDPTGGRTVTWGTLFKGAPALTTTANSISRFSFLFNGTHYIESRANGAT